MPKPDCFRVEYLNQSLDMRFIYAGEDIVKNENRVFWTIDRGKSKEDAKTKRIEV